MALIKPSLLVIVASWCISTAWGYNFECPLYCYNGGTCMHGDSKFGRLPGVHRDPHDHSSEGGSKNNGTDIVLPFHAETNANGMYCSCPKGFTGLQCEIKFVICGDLDGEDRHTCFNGSECIREKTDRGEIYYRCECDVANSIMTAKYAGRFCEHAATVFCGQHSNDASFGSASSFCVNGGRCKEKEFKDQKNIGCDCLPGFEGPHCEYQVGQMQGEGEMSSTHALGAGVIAIIVIGGIIVLTAFWWIGSAGSSKKSKKKTTGRRANGEII